MTHELKIYALSLINFILNDISVGWSAVLNKKGFIIIMVRVIKYDKIPIAISLFSGTTDPLPFNSVSLSGQPDAEAYNYHPGRLTSGPLMLLTSKNWHHLSSLLSVLSHGSGFCLFLSFPLPLTLSSSLSLTHSLTLSCQSSL